MSSWVNPKKLIQSGSNLEYYFLPPKFHPHNFICLQYFLSITFCPELLCCGAEHLSAFAEIQNTLICVEQIDCFVKVFGIKKYLRIFSMFKIPQQSVRAIWGK